MPAPGDSANKQLVLLCDKMPFEGFFVARIFVTIDIGSSFHLGGILMFKTMWKNWLLAITVVLATNAATWHREKIAKLFELEKPNGAVNIGVLIDDKLLSGNEAEDFALAQSYLSENYHWVSVQRKKVPLPFDPFIKGTGFHFQPVSRNQKKPQLLVCQ